ncbi:MAG: hypothetical protein ACQEVD_02315 [Actinomycetota bacterium]
MADSSFSWLPERHLSVAATISHADEIIGEIGDLLFKYQTQPGGIVHFKEVTVGNISQTVVESIAPIPRKIPLLVADALNTLRAAIEHTLYTEVEFRDGPNLDSSAARLVEMPACRTFDSFGEWQRKKLRDRPPSLTPGTELVRRIEGLQPLNLRINMDEHPLLRLTRFTNHAKHRNPAITAVGLPAMYTDAELPNIIGKNLENRSEKPLEAGDVIAETPIGTRSAATLFPNVAIKRPDTPRWPVLIRELDEIANWVRTQAIPRLISGSSTDRNLPTRYSITVGQTDDRAAMSLGTSKSGAMRLLEKLRAASARSELAEIISAVGDRSSLGHIEAWLGQLSDEEVLKRMSSIEMVATNGIGAAYRNLDILRNLYQEAFAWEEAEAHTLQPE